MACTTYKSLTLAFTAPSIPPADGYRVKWRVVGEANYITVSPNPKTTPIVIPQVPACSNIEGTIETACGGGSYGAPTAFVVSPGGTGTCSYYSVVNKNPGANTGSSVIIRYKPCGESEFISRTINPGIDNAYMVGICADDTYGVNIVSGEATITKETPCTTDNARLIKPDGTPYP